MYSVGPINVSKQLILNNVPEEKLMEHYLGIPVRKGIFKSPLRSDTKPTCAFFRNKSGKLIFKDFRGDFQGDFIAVVMHKFNCSYNKALQIVANDFKLLENTKLVINKPLIEYTGSEFKETTPSMIQIEINNFNEHELNWWGSFGITSDVLKKFKVYSCKNVFLNNNIFSLYKNNQLVFGYYNGKLDGVEQWRIYFPGNKKFRFISNWRSNSLQGLHTLPKNGGELLVVTKSLKDVMTLYTFNNISAIAPVSENCFLTQTQYDTLAKKFKKIVIFYDTDSAGISNMNKFRKQFPNIVPVWIPRKYKVKDISDFYKKYGRDKTKQLIDSYVSKL